MGELDEAIREHLELKRRRGADPAEVARIERDALGPVVRTRTAGRVDRADEPPVEEHDAPAEADETFEEPAFAVDRPLDEPGPLADLEDEDFDEATQEFRIDDLRHSHDDDKE